MAFKSLKRADFLASKFWNFFSPFSLLNTFHTFVTLFSPGIRIDPGAFSKFYGFDRFEMSSFPVPFLDL